MRFVLVARVAAGCLWLLPALGTAQTPKPHREEMVVTGTYAPIPLEEADRTVQTIPTGSSPAVFRNAMDALQSDPSVDLRQRSPGIQGDLSIRGSSFGQTLVMVNGFRMNDPQTGHNNLDLPFPFIAIDRIEVLEGSGSTLYGSDAVGGAVNFIKRPPPTSEIRFGAGAGSFGTNSQNGSIALRRGEASEHLTFTRELSTGFQPNRDYRTLAFGSETIWRTRLGLSDVLLGLSDRPFGADQFYGNYPSWERMKGWFAGWRQDLSRDTVASFSYRRHTDLFDLIRDRPAFSQNRHITESWTAALRRTHEIRESTRIYYGAEGYRDIIDSTNLGYRKRDRGAAYAAVDVRALRRFSFNAGGREELITGGNRRFTPSLSGGYWASSRVKFRGSVSSAYRLPTFTDLYYSDPANKGNPNLRPETAWNYEGGVQVTGGKLSTDFIVFHRRDSNNIDYVRRSPGGIWQAANLTRLRFTGFEMKCRWQVRPHQRIDILYTALHGAQGALDGLQSKYVFQYPVHAGTVTWWGQLPGKVETRVRFQMLQRFGRDAYPLAEFSASRSLKYFRPYLQMTNITNTGYEEIVGVRMPGRAIFGGLELYWRGK